MDLSSLDFIPGDWQIQGAFQSIEKDNDDCISGRTAAALLRTSQLPKHILSKIWSLSDSQRRGHLNEVEFRTAIRLVAMAKQGKNLDVEYAREQSDNMHKPPEPPVVNDPWYVGEEERSSIQTLFDGYDRTGKKFLTGKECRDIFQKSRLPSSALRQIWSIVDTKKQGRIDKHGFVVAMVLTRRASDGHPIPHKLPDGLQTIVDIMESPMQESQYNSSNISRDSSVASGLMWSPPVDAYEFGKKKTFSPSENGSLGGRVSDVPPVMPFPGSSSGVDPQYIRPQGFGFQGTFAPSESGSTTGIMVDASHPISAATSFEGISQTGTNTTAFSQGFGPQESFSAAEQGYMGSGFSEISPVIPASSAPVSNAPTSNHHQGFGFAETFAQPEGSSSSGKMDDFSHPIPVAAPPGMSPTDNATSFSQGFGPQESFSAAEQGYMGGGFSEVPPVVPASSVPVSNAPASNHHQGFGFAETFVQPEGSSSSGKMDDFSHPIPVAAPPGMSPRDNATPFSQGFAPHASAVEGGVLSSGSPDVTSSGPLPKDPADVDISPEMPLPSPSSANPVSVSAPTAQSLNTEDTESTVSQKPTTDSGTVVQRDVHTSSSLKSTNEMDGGSDIINMETDELPDDEKCRPKEDPESIEDNILSSALADLGSALSSGAAGSHPPVVKQELDSEATFDETQVGWNDGETVEVAGPSVPSLHPVKQTDSMLAEEAVSTTSKFSADWGTWNAFSSPEASEQFGADESHAVSSQSKTASKLEDQSSTVNEHNFDASDSQPESVAPMQTVVNEKGEIVSFDGVESHTHSLSTVTSDTLESDTQREIVRTEDDLVSFPHAVGDVGIISTNDEMPTMSDPCAVEKEEEEGWNNRVSSGGNSKEEVVSTGGWRLDDPHRGEDANKEFADWTAFGNEEDAFEVPVPTADSAVVADGVSEPTLSGSLIAEAKSSARELKLLSAQLAEEKSALSGPEEENDHIRASIREQKEECRRIKSKIEVINGKKEMIEEMMEYFKDEVNNLNSQKESYMEVLSERESSLEERHTILNELKESITVTRTQIVSLKSQLAESKKVLARLNHEIDTHKARARGVDMDHITHLRKTADGALFQYEKAILEASLALRLNASTSAQQIVAPSLGSEMAESTDAESGTEDGKVKHDFAAVNEVRGKSDLISEQKESTSSQERKPGIVTEFEGDWQGILSSVFRDKEKISGDEQHISPNVKEAKAKAAIGDIFTGDFDSEFADFGKTGSAGDEIVESSKVVEDSKAEKKESSMEDVFDGDFDSAFGDFGKEDDLVVDGRVEEPSKVIEDSKVENESSIKEGFDGDFDSAFRDFGKEDDLVVDGKVEEPSKVIEDFKVEEKEESSIKEGFDGDFDSAFGEFGKEDDLVVDGKVEEPSKVIEESKVEEKKESPIEEGFDGDFDSAFGDFGKKDDLVIDRKVEEPSKVIEDSKVEEKKESSIKEGFDGDFGKEDDLVVDGKVEEQSKVIEESKVEEEKESSIEEGFDGDFNSAFGDFGKEDDLVVDGKVEEPSKVIEDSKVEEKKESRVEDSFDGDFGKKDGFMVDEIVEETSKVVEKKESPTEDRFDGDFGKEDKFMVGGKAEESSKTVREKKESPIEDAFAGDFGKEDDFMVDVKVDESSKVVENSKVEEKSESPITDGFDGDFGKGDELVVDGKVEESSKAVRDSKVGEKKECTIEDAFAGDFDSSFGDFGKEDDFMVDVKADESSKVVENSKVEEMNESPITDGFDGDFGKGDELVVDGKVEESSKVVENSRVDEKKESPIEDAFAGDFDSSFGDFGKEVDFGKAEESSMVVEDAKVGEKKESTVEDDFVSDFGKADSGEDEMIESSKGVEDSKVKGSANAEIVGEIGNTAGTEADSNSEELVKDMEGMIPSTTGEVFDNSFDADFGAFGEESDVLAAGNEDSSSREIVVDSKEEAPKPKFAFEGGFGDTFEADFEDFGNDGGKAIGDQVEGLQTVSSSKEDKPSTDEDDFEDFGRDFNDEFSTFDETDFKDMDPAL